MTDDAQAAEPSATTRDLEPARDAEPDQAALAPQIVPAGDTRRAVLWSAAEARGVPLRAILTTIAAVVVVYLAAKVVYRLRDVILLIVVAGFIALLLNPLVVALERWVGGAEWRSRR